MPILSGIVLKQFMERKIRCELVDEPSPALKLFMIPGLTKEPEPLEAIRAITDAITTNLETNGIKWDSMSWHYSPADRHYVLYYGVKSEDLASAEALQKSFGRSLP